MSFNKKMKAFADAEKKRKRIETRPRYYLYSEPKSSFFNSEQKWAIRDELIESTVKENLDKKYAQKLFKELKDKKYFFDVTTGRKYI